MTEHNKACIDFVLAFYITEGANGDWDYRALIWSKTLFRCQRESGMRKATGSYRNYSIPGKTAALVPEFAVEGLPSAELQPRFLRLQ